MTRVLAALGVIAGVLIAVEAAMVRDAHYAPGTFAALGLVGCAVIVVVSKLLGKAWLQRPEPPDE